MKKLNSFCLVSLWLLYSGLLLAQNQGLDFYLYSSDNVRSVENSLRYLFFPMANTSLSLQGQSYLENRLSFNQENKNATLGLEFSIRHKSLEHRLRTDYSTLFDASDLEPSPYVNKTAMLGYSLVFSPVDSLALSLAAKGILRREHDRYVAGEHLASQGFDLDSQARWGANLSQAAYGLSAGLQRSRLAWEAYDTARMNAYYNFANDLFSFASYSNYNYRKEDIYILQAPISDNYASYYSLSDTQMKKNLDVAGDLVITPLSFVQIQLSESYSQKETVYSQDSTRGSMDQTNLANGSVSFSLHPRLQWNTEAGHSYATKEYVNVQNTRYTETRRLSSRLAWEYADYDSLIALANLDLQIIQFPHDAHRWDNDLLSKSLRLGWKHYWSERIKLGGWVSLGRKEDVYLDSLLSSNNKVISSYALAPECSILFGDRLSFNQSYQVRAEYSDYLFQTGQENSFYRQLGFKYNLVFDTLPLIVRLQDPRWLKLPFRNSPHNAFQLDLGFAYEENQYAREKTDYYELFAKNKRWTGSLGIRHDIGAFFWNLVPKYSWGTWTEYSARLGCAWQFNNDSVVELSLAPYAEDLANVDWRSTFSLNLRF